MAQTIQMPRRGNTVDECLLLEWNVREGDSVETGDVLCSIETDRAALAVKSSASGTVLKLLASQGDVVPVFTDILVLGKAGENVELSSLAINRGVVEMPCKTTPPQSAAMLYPVWVAPPEGVHKAVSPRARKLAAKYNIDASAISGTGARGRVVAADVQKAVDNNSAIEEEFCRAPCARAEIPEIREEPVCSTGANSSAPPVDTEDADMTPPAPCNAEAKSETVVPYTKTGEYAPQIRTMPAQCTLASSADASALVAMRKALCADAASAASQQVSITDLVCWTVCRTLSGFPEINALIDAGAETVTRHCDVDLSIAVDTPRGLAIPVLSGANRLSLLEFSQARSRLCTDCRNGSVNPGMLAGGTFTIFTPGEFGIEYLTPVINQNQAGALGVGAVTNAAVPGEDGGFEFRPRIGLSLTVDLQAVDGALASRFLQAVRKGLETLEPVRTGSEQA